MNHLNHIQIFLVLTIIVDFNHRDDNIVVFLMLEQILKTQESVLILIWVDSEMFI